MRTLFAISIFALVALLWAGLSMAQHVRRARRKRRRELAEAAVAVAPAAELSFTELTPYSEAVVSRIERTTDSPIDPAGGEELVTAAEVAPSSVAHDEPQAVLVSNSDVDDSPASTPRSEERAATATTALPVVPEATSDLPVVPEFVQEANPLLERTVSWETPAQAIEVLLPVEERPQDPFAAETASAHLTPSIGEAPLPRAEPSVAKPEPAPGKISLPGFPTPKRPLSPKHPLSRLAKKMERPDWAYFNKDMGDLTDPYEAPRSKPKDRAGN